jgi:hypothetical protein
MRHISLRQTICYCHLIVVPLSAQKAPTDALAKTNKFELTFFFFPSCCLAMMSSGHVSAALIVSEGNCGVKEVGITCHKWMLFMMTLTFIKAHRHMYDDDRSLKFEGEIGKLESTSGANFLFYLPRDA